MTDPNQNISMPLSINSPHGNGRPQTVLQRTRSPLIVGALEPIRAPGESDHEPWRALIPTLNSNYELSSRFTPIPPSQVSYSSPPPYQLLPDNAPFAPPYMMGSLPDPPSLTFTPGVSSTRHIPLSASNEPSVSAPRLVLGTNTIQSPPLKPPPQVLKADGSNFEPWRNRVKLSLSRRPWLDLISESFSPRQLELAGLADHDYEIRKYFLFSMDMDLMSRFIKQPSAYSMWNSILNKFAAHVRVVDFGNAARELYSASIRPSDSTRSHIGRMHDPFDNFRSVGGQISNEGFLYVLKGSFRTANDPGLRLDAERSDARTVKEFITYIVKREDLVGLHGKQWD